MRILTIGLLCCMGLLGVPAGASTYYVATTGSDSSTAAQAQNLATPWLTIQHAANNTVAGDTVIVEGGTYAISSFLNLSSSGTSGSYITYECATQWACTLQLGSGVSPGISINGSYNAFLNFEVIGNSDGSNSTGIKCNSGNGCNVSGNKIHHIGTQTSCPLGAAIEPNNGNNEIINANYIYDVSPPRTAARCNHEQGIYASGGTYTGGVITNNVIVECYQCYAIQFDGGAPSGWTVANNTIVNSGQGSPNNSGGGIYFNCATSGVTCDNMVFNNNIFDNTGGDSCITEATVATGGVNGTHNSYSNNEFYNCFGGNTFIHGALTSPVNSDPLFVSNTGDQTGNYELGTGSPGINGGTSSGAPDTDFLGNSRGGGIWIGAYQTPSAAPTIYYVSASSGSDANNGTSAATPWATLGAHVNGGTFAAGSAIYLKRGDTWNEQLIPPSSGRSGNPISFDAYGTGAAPVLTPVINLAGASWTHNSGNIYTTTLSTAIASPQINNLQLGNVWGRKRSPNPGCATAGVILGYGDFCVLYPTLYVYSPSGTLPSTYYSSIVPVVGQTSGLAMVSIVGKVWLTLQHIKIQTFDFVGVSVAGASDHLVFANMEADGMVPVGTTPLGFYVNATNPTDIQFINDEANLNYDGFKFDGTATAITVTNCRGYANRGAGLVDNSGHATYSYSHFYGNNMAQFPTSDVAGGIAGSGNISSAIAPVVTNFARYPARFSLTVDDVGSSPNTEAYINSLPAVFAAHGTGTDKFNAAVVPSYTVDWGSVNAWYAAGNEIDSHSWSHQYYTTNTNPQNATPYPNAPALVLQYTGSGTAATLTISGGMLSTTVTGASGDSISPAISLSSYTALQLYSYLQSLPHYLVQQNSLLWTTNLWPLSRPNTHAVNLADVATQDIKTAPYALLYDQTKLEPDEMTASKAAIQTNVPGLTESFYVYPDGIEDPTIEADAVAAGYTAARGSLAMKDQTNQTLGANSLYSNGVNIQNITSLAVAQIHGLTQAQINQMAASLVFRAAAWGIPYGFFTHYNSRGDGTPDISNVELGYLLDAVTANGGVWLTNTGLANALTAGTELSGSTRYIQNPTGGALDLGVAGANSPTVGRGTVTAYPVDLNGTNRATLGTWDIGASTYLSQRYGAGVGSGNTYIGGWPETLMAQLPQNWVNANEWAGTTTNTISFPATGSGGSWSCGVTNYGPYTAGSQTSLQQAVDDAEACRTANASGTMIKLPAGMTYSGTTGLVLPQTAGDSSTNFIVLSSTTPLPAGQTVCSHGIQDNLASSTQPGIRNLGCNASAMSYQLGTTVTPVSGAFTLANGNATNTSAYNDLASMYTIECTSANCHPISTGNYDANNVGPHHFAILNAEVRPQAGLASANSIIKLGFATETLSSQRASHIHIAYSYIHGDWTDAPVGGGVATGPPTGSNSIPAGLAFSGCVYCSVSYSYLDRMIRPGAEGHAIYLGYWDQVKLVHNWVEGSSIGLFSGGFASTTTLTGFGYDVEDRGNRYTYPYSWILANDAGYCVNGLSCSGNGYVRKNSHEFKNGNRILDDGNINENVDNSGAQNGIAMSWKADNCSVGFCNNYWISLENLTRTNGVSRNTCTGMSWGFRPATASGNGGGVTQPVEWALVSNNLSYNISLSNPGCSTAGPEAGFRVNQAGTGNTWSASCTRDSAGATSNCSLTSTAGGTQSNFNVGDPIYVSGCTDASFNTSSTAMGPAALSGTTPTGLTVVYTNAGTANATTSGCTVANLQGWPRYLTHAHNSEFINTTSASSPYSTASNGSEYQVGRNLSFTNDIFVGGGITGGWQEGSHTETRSFDPTTEVMNNILFPGRDSLVTCTGHSSPAAGGIAACYTEYSNSSVSSTPTTLYGVPTSYCIGNDPTVGSCVGILGGMSQASFPLTLNDWHSYRLCHTGDATCNGKASSFAAGQTNHGSDGTDLGVNVGAVDTAETATQYVCQAACGSGPSSDVVSTGGGH